MSSAARGASGVLASSTVTGPGSSAPSRPGGRCSQRPSRATCRDNCSAQRAQQSGAAAPQCSSRKCHVEHTARGLCARLPYAQAAAGCAGGHRRATGPARACIAPAVQPCINGPTCLMPVMRTASCARARLCTSAQIALQAVRGDVAVCTSAGVPQLPMAPMRKPTWSTSATHTASGTCACLPLSA